MNKLKMITAGLTLACALFSTAWGGTAYTYNMNGKTYTFTDEDLSRNPGLKERLAKYLVSPQAQKPENIPASGPSAGETPQAAGVYTYNMNGKTYTFTGEELNRNPGLKERLSKYLISPQARESNSFGQLPQAGGTPPPPASKPVAVSKPKASGPAAGASATLLQIALQYTDGGIRYSRGGNGDSGRADCSGFVQFVLRQASVLDEDKFYRRSANALRQAAINETSLGNGFTLKAVAIPQPGDIVFFNGHTGFFMEYGDGGNCMKIVHSTTTRYQSGPQVSECSAYYARAERGFGRIVKGM